MSGYQNLQDEADEYVPTSEQIQQEEAQQPTFTQKQEPIVHQQQQQPNVATTGQQQQAFYAVPVMGQDGQQQIAYIPQSQYAQFLQQQQMYQQYLQQQQLLQQQQQQSGQPQIQLPPLPNVNHIPQQQPTYVPSTLPPTIQPTTTTPIVTNTTVQVTDESYVKVQGVEPALVLLCNLVFPGLGHFVIGQQSKGAIYLVVSVVLTTILAVLCAFFIGIPLIPLVLIYNILVMIDGYVIADRIRKGYPVLKGECYCRITSWGVSLVETKSPVFVHGSADEPAVWQLQCRQVDRQRNL